MKLFGAKAASGNSAAGAGDGAAILGVGCGTDRRGLAPVESVRLALAFSQCYLDSFLLRRMK